MSLTFKKYQDAAHRTAVYPEEIKVLYCALGLAGEAGEVANKVKKLYRDADTEEARASIRQEIGGVLWYCAELATCLGFDLEAIAEGNTTELAGRKERGTLHGSGDDR